MIRTDAFVFLPRRVSDSVSTHRHGWLHSRCGWTTTPESREFRLDPYVAAAFMSAVWTPEWCGLGTALSIQDVLLPHTTAAGSQRLAGECSPRRRSTSPSGNCVLRRRPIPASCHDQGAAAPRGDIRRIRGSFCSVASRLSDDRALLGARLPAKLPGSILLRAALPELLEPERTPLAA